MRTPSNPPTRPEPGPATAGSARLARQKAALKANLARRKTQAHARTATETAENDDNETKNED